MRLAIMTFWAVASLFTLAGCSTFGGGAAGGGGVAGGPGAAGGLATSGVGAGGTFQGYSLDDPNSPLAQRVIYFEFDSSEVRPEDRDVVAAHAAFLAANPRMRVVLEGHTDERGSREYNIGLGERRALSVQRLLELQGASPDQITTVSYGEEKPVDPRHTPDAWAVNRRVEIVYSGS